MKRLEPVLVTGATGYVGGRLVPRLLQAGYRVRAAGRSLDKLKSRPWATHPGIELVVANALDLDSMMGAARGCWAAYYLVHSMQPGCRDFQAADRLAAQNLVAAAETLSLERVIYLGGLGERESELSHHLKSRSEVADILRSSKVPATILRAAMIIGSGSASFEILRYLVDRLPVMITPRWVNTRCQPIAIRNVLNYLIGCLECQETAGKTFDIGGPDILSYRDLMELYQEQTGLKRRLVVGVPLFTPRLSSYWIHLVTPVPAYIAQPLAEGLRNPAVCQENAIKYLLPQELLNCQDAIRLAIDRLHQQQIESHWTDAGVIPPAEWHVPGDPHWSGGTVYEDRRRIIIHGTPEEVWQPVVRVGGRTGWYYGNWLWRLRGTLDKLSGGVGLKRGRRHESELAVGDAVDFWRVAAIAANERLLLVSEMNLPGQAVLEFRLRRVADGLTELQQNALFMPSGLAGMLYWWAVSPFHALVFDGMLRGIAQATGRQIEKGPERSEAVEPLTLA